MLLLWAPGLVWELTRGSRVKSALCLGPVWELTRGSHLMKGTLLGGGICKEGIALDSDAAA